MTKPTNPLPLSSEQLIFDYRLAYRSRQSGFSGANPRLRQMIDLAAGKRKEKLIDFYQYIFHHQDGLLDLEQRSLPGKYASLGTIEGNVDKLVVHRMKGRGCCWKLAGARAMLAICQYRNEIGSMHSPIGHSTCQSNLLQRDTSIPGRVPSLRHACLSFRPSSK